jgi:tetratricopeptide (TPR) repeat protein
MDVDYANDKGSYVITRTGPEMKLATSDIITWDDYRREDGQLTLGLLSQISPDGRYALSTVKDLSIFMAKPDLAFSQLFFPFMGIVGVYDREAKRFFSLPGADDPALVQSNPTWSPDGQWVVFARTRAVEIKGARNPGRILLDGEEADKFLRQTKDYRYDLYRVPFNGGKGGKAEPLRGASQNGRSNYFPKYSPDGRWIVFCQAKNYMLLQPDSELYIIPSEGGSARRLGCNLGRMNSWHSWSPDGQWLVFSSKAHSDYTQLYLARINEHGEASPPVWLAHMVEPGRAANIPEFVALPAEGIMRIREQFLDDYSYVRAGDEFYRAGEVDQAIEKYRIALSLNPDNLTVRRQLGYLLYPTRNRKEAVEHMRATVRLAPQDPFARFNLGSALRSMGDYSNAIVQFEEGVLCLTNMANREYDPVDKKHALPEAMHFCLGSAYQQVGSITNAERCYREALRLAPDYPEVHYNLGTLLLRSGRIDEAQEHFMSVIKLMPEFADAHNCLGVIRQRQNRQAEALACFQKAVKYDTNNWQAHFNLANAYLAEGNRDMAIPELRETLRLKPSYEPAQLALAKAQAQTTPPAR